MRGTIILVMLILAVSFVSAAATTITDAYVDADCGSDLALLSMEQENNSHAANGTGVYTYKLCVAGTNLAKSSANGDHVIKLEQATNSEAQFEGSYAYPIYLGSTNANYDIDCQKGDNGGTPIVALSSDSAAHLSEDGASGYTDAYCNVTSVGYPVLVNATDGDDSSPDVRALGATINVSTVSYDNEGDGLTLFVCNSSSATSGGCSDAQFCTASDSANLSCTFSANQPRGTTVDWYAFIFDAEGLAASANPISGDYKVNTLPAITDIDSDVPYTYIGGSVTFYCYVTDADSQAMTAKFYLKANGSVSWDKVDGEVMSWNAGSSRFEYSGFDTSGESSGQEYDAMCNVSDGLEYADYSEEPTEFYITSDYDSDGVLDPDDSMSGNESWVEVLSSNSDVNFSMTVDGDSDLTDPSAGWHQVEYYDDDVAYVNVTHNFADGPSNWYDLEDDKFGRSESGYLTVVAGLDGQNATIFVPRWGSGCNMQYCVGMDTISLICDSGWVNITGTSTDGLCFYDFDAVSDMGVRDLGEGGQHGLIPELFGWLGDIFKKLFGVSMVE